MPSTLLVVTNHTEMPATKAEQEKGAKPPATGWYLPEVAHPYYVLKEAGHEVVFVSPKGGVAMCDVGSMDAFKGDEQCTKFVKEVMKDGGVDTVKVEALAKAAEEHDAVFFAGGHGVMWDFPECEAQNKAAEAIYAKGGVVAAVCHGPAALVNLKAADGTPLVANKLVTAFTNSEEDVVCKTEVMPFALETVLKDKGAKFVSMKDWSDNTVVDGRLVTGQNPASATSCAKALLKAL